MSKNKRKPTAYGVFIIECLRPGDAADAKVMHQILEMSNIIALYHTSNTILEFEQQVSDFKKSNFRYLHLSCHADAAGLEIEGQDYSNQRLADLLKDGMDNKRLFMSACQGANRNLAKKIINGCNAASLIGTPVKLYFDKSVLFWPSFYHLINEIDQVKMNRKLLISTLQKCTDLFGVAINYYSKINVSPNALRRLKIRKGQPPTDERLITKPLK